MTSTIEWVSEANPVEWRKLGPTCSQKRFSECIDALYERRLRSELEQGIDPETAVANVAVDYIRPATTVRGAPTREFNSALADEICQWIYYEQEWISPNDHIRSRALNIHARPESISAAIEELYEHKVWEAQTQGMSAEDAKESVEAYGFRYGKSHLGNRVWQYQPSVAEELRQYILNPPWVNSHTRNEEIVSGIVTRPQIRDAALANDFKTQIMRKMVELSCDKKTAEAWVRHTMLRPSTTLHGANSWDIYKDYLEEALALPTLAKRHMSEWLFPESSALEEGGIRGNRQTRIDGMRLLEQESEIWLIRGGIPAEEAKKYVATNLVREVEGKAGLTPQIHPDHVETLRKSMVRALTLPNVENRDSDWLYADSRELDVAKIPKDSAIRVGAMRLLAHQAVEWLVKGGIDHEMATDYVRTHVVREVRNRQGIVPQVHPNAMERYQQAAEDVQYSPRYKVYADQARGGRG